MIKAHALQLIPLGFAIINPASAPNTSKGPANKLISVPSTWTKIILAASPSLYFDYEGTITTNAFNLQVGGDFSYNDSANDFIWGEFDTLTVSGDANIVAADFANSGTITVINSFNATVDAFLNQTGATITAFECDIVHTTSYTDNGTIDCLGSVTTITDIARPTNGLSNNSYTDFNIPSNGVVFNNNDSVGTSQLLGSISANPNYNEGDAASIILVQVDGTDISAIISIRSSMNNIAFKSSNGCTSLIEKGIYCCIKAINNSNSSAISKISCNNISIS